MSRIVTETILKALEFTNILDLSCFPSFLIEFTTNGSTYYIVTKHIFLRPTSMLNIDPDNTGNWVLIDSLLVLTLKPSII